MYLAALIPLLTTAISVLAVGSLAADDRDSIKLTNLGSGEIALWVSEKNKISPFTSKVLKGNTGDNGITGTFTRPLGTVIAYTDDHPPTLNTHVRWTQGIDTVEMRLDDIHQISLYVWVVNVGNSDFETMKMKALNANVRTSQIWLDERQGIEFSNFHIEDATKKSFSANFITEPFTNCNTSDLKSKIGFKKDMINVYYLETVRVVNAQGYTVEGSTYGEYCGSEHLIALGSNSLEDLLAHELGHAFNLEHIDHLDRDFGKTNVMHSASTTRNFLTEGQTFRAIANTGSALNTLYHTTRADSDVKIECSFDSKSNCPEIAMRIWMSVGENGETAAQPKKKEALQVYLDLDHEDFLEKPGKKKALPRALQNVLKSNTKKLTKKFSLLLDKGPNDQVLQERERFLKEQWERREAFLGKNPNLGLTEADLLTLRDITRKEYLDQGRDQLTQRYREKAIGALRAINTVTANAALTAFRNKTSDKVLKEIIDNVPPEKPAGLTVN